MQKHKHLRFEEVLEEELRNDSEFRKEWETSETQYRVIKKLIRQRLAQDMTQRDLAKKAGIKQPSLARIESGGVMPSLNMLDKLAKAFGSRLEVQFTP